MNALYILFRSSRFKLSEVKAHFINPCCFGEDLAKWLRTKLTEKGIESRQPYQEDWGWELPVEQGSDSYFLGMGGNSDQLSDDKNSGEWRIIVEKRRSLAQRVRGNGKITADDPMLNLLKSILDAEGPIQEVQLIDERQAQAACSQPFA